MIEEIQAYKTSDARIFESAIDADEHQTKIDLKKTIIDLFGGSSNDICPNDSSFSNGGGYFLISKEKFDEANDLVKELLILTDQESYSITSRACYENEYTSYIGNLYACLIIQHDSIKRVGQPYYAQNPTKIGNTNYTK